MQFQRQQQFPASNEATSSTTASRKPPPGFLAMGRMAENFPITGKYGLLKTDRIGIFDRVKGARDVTDDMLDLLPGQHMPPGRH